MIAFTIQFQAAIRRPKPLMAGMVAEFFAENGEDADRALLLGRSDLLDALVRIDLGGEMGSFEAYVRRPLPRQAGMVACFYGENGPAADAIAALSLSKFLDQRVTLDIALLKLPDGREADSPSKKERPHARAAKDLWMSSLWGRPEVVTAFGTQEEFHLWLESEGARYGNAFDRMRAFCWAALRTRLQVTSMADAEPAAIRELFESMGISRLLPHHF